MKLSDLKSLIKEYGGPPISRKAYLKQKPMDPKLDEGRMKELHGYIERGMTAQQIAKKMKLDVKTIKALMPESVNEIREPLTVPKSLAKFVVYKKIGLSKIKAVAHLRAMPKGKELDRILDKYDADGVMAMSKIKRNKMQVEAVTEAKGKYSSDAQMDDFLKGMEKNPDVKKMSKHYNRPVGDIVNALRARVSVNRLRGGNVYTLNFTDKDSKLKVKAKKRYAPLKEAVSPAQQAAIAIAKKEKGEKPQEESRSYRAKRGAAERSAIAMNRSYSDARRDMKGNTKGMATTKKDKNVSATDDDRKAASKNIIMQLRKAADLSTGADVEFEKGKGKVDRRSAQDVLAKFNRLRKPMDKEKFQQSIKSLADIKKILGR